MSDFILKCRHCGLWDNYKRHNHVRKVCGHCGKVNDFSQKPTKKLPTLTKEGFTAEFRKAVNGQKYTLMQRYMIANQVLVAFQPTLTDPDWYDGVVENA